MAVNLPIDRESIKTSEVVNRLSKVNKEALTQEVGSPEPKDSAVSEREKEIERLDQEIYKGKQLIKHLLRVYKQT